MRARTAFHPRRTLAAAIAVLAIVGVTAFGGALAAWATPLSVTIGSAGGGSLASGGTISGAVTWNGADGNVRVEVTDRDGNVSNFCGSDFYLAATTTWTCDVTFTLGVNNVQAFATDVADPGVTIASNVVVFTYGDMAPVTVVAPGTSTHGLSANFSGTGPIGGHVTLMGYIMDGSPPGDPACGPTLVDSWGNWSCTATVPTYDQYALYGTGTHIQNGAVTSSGFSLFSFNPPLILPTVNCTFSPGGHASVTAGALVDASVWAVEPGTEGGIDTAGPCGGNMGTTVADVGPWGPSSIQNCTPTCNLDFAPGTYNVHYQFGDSAGQGYDFTSFDYFFTVPNAPTLTRVNSAGTASGTGSPGTPVRVVNDSGTQLCTSVVQAGGSWSCHVTLRTTPGKARAFQVDSASGGSSAYSAYVSLPTLAVAEVTPTPTPTPTTTPRPWNFSIGGSSTLSPGDTVVIDGEDAPAGAVIDAELHSTPVTIGSTTANADGTFSITATIPEDAEPGDHHIVVVVTPTDGTAPTVVEQPVTLVVPDAAPAEAAENSAGGAALTGRQLPGFTSSLTPGFISPAEILSNPLALATAGSLGLALVLLVLVPAEFFGEALANHYGTLGGFFARRRGLKRFVEGVHEWVETHRFLAGAALVFVTSVVFCFIDPGFGFDLTSLRLLLSCAASILLVNFLSAGITERVAEKAWKVPTRLEVMPWGLAIAIVGVIASRLLNFSPGFLIGSIIGVSVIGEVAKKFEMRVILLWAGVVWAVAMVSWVLAPVIPVLPASNPAGFITGFITDSLVATSAAGLTALLVALLPIALFDGGELFKASKLWWAVAFGVAVASFSLVVLPSASNWLGLGDGLLRWLLLTLGFIAVAIVTYLIAVRRNGTGRSRLLKSKSQTPAS